MSVKVNIGYHYKMNGRVARREMFARIENLLINTTIDMDEDGYITSYLRVAVFTDYSTLNKIYYYNTYAYMDEESTELDDDPAHVISIEKHQEAGDEWIPKYTTFVFDGGDRFCSEVTIDHTANTLASAVSVVTTKTMVDLERLVKIESAINPEYKRVTFYAGSEEDLIEFNKKLPEEVRLHGWTD